MRRKSTCAFCLGLLIASIAGASVAQADDWPQWRGPNRDGISKEKGLLKEWPEEGPQLLWQVKELGEGYSTPSIVGDRLYLISNKGTDNEFIHALSAKNGEQIWQAKLGEVGKNEGPQYPGARSTPTVDGDLIFALGSNGDLACLSLEGKIIWQKNLREEFGGKPGNWAYSESPLVDGDAVVVTPGGSEATVVALQKSSGDLIWKCPTPESDEAAYSSIVIVESAGKKQYVQFLQKGLVGVDAKTGKFLWRYEKPPKEAPPTFPRRSSRTT